MTNDQASWVGSIMCIGSGIGSLFFSWLADKIGRKRSMIIVTIPVLASWALILFTTNINYLLVSRFCGGFAGGGIFCLVPLYVVEIAEDRVRGRMGSYLVLTCNIGILLAFIAGNYLPYKVVPMVLSIIPLLFLLGLFTLPESPVYLMKNNKVEDAENSLKYFRNHHRVSKESSTEFKNELEKLKFDFIKTETDTKDQPESHPFSWSDFKTRIARKAFIIGIALMALNQFCGCFAMLNYTASIFQQSGSNLSPNMSAIIVGIIQLLGTYISTTLVERAGRKFLIAMSAIGTGIGLSCLGLYTWFDSNEYNIEVFNWVPIVSFSTAICAASMGVLNLPFLVVSEIMPPKIRNVGSTICLLTMWMFTFLMIKCLPLLTATLGMHGTMFIFSICCFSGALFVIIVVPETKGKSIDMIMELM